MRVWIVLAALALLPLLVVLSGCAGWRSTSAQAIGTASAGLKAVKVRAIPYWDAKCLTVARQCRESPCAKLSACHSDAREFLALVKTGAQLVDSAAAVVLAAIAVDGAGTSKQKAIEAGKRVLAEIGVLAARARSLGVIK